MPRREPINTLGTASLATGVLALLTGGLLGPLGIGLGLAGLRNTPRFHAVVGIVLSVISLLLLAYLWLLGGGRVIATSLGLAPGPNAGTITVLSNGTSPHTLAATQLSIFAAAAMQLRQVGGSWPPPAEMCKLDPGTGLSVVDPWGNPYRLHAGPNQIVWFSSDGPDGKPDTQDDIESSRVR
jgi:hypothetical protein